MKTLEELVAESRRLANELFHTEEAPCVRLEEGTSCIRKEDERIKDLRKRGIYKGFADYDQERLCLSCAAYWHMELAAQALHQFCCTRQKRGGKT